MEQSTALTRREAVQAISAHLCSICRDMIEHWKELRAQGVLMPVDDPYDPASQVSRSHHKNTSQIREAAAAGCGICSAVEADIVLKNGSIWKFHDECGGATSCGLAHGTIRLSRWAKEVYMDLAFETLPLSDDSLFMYEGLESAYTGAPSVLKRARMWFQMCIDEHVRCGGAINPRYLPPRLLAIDDQRRIRLVDTKEADPSQAYATLSYCWGRHPRHLKLTPRTEDALRNGKSAVALARTFSDAIYVCDQLRIRHLWIDSLCIIQEGPEHAADWQRHLTEMCRIYEHCTLNISADQGEDAEAGCFTHRNVEHVKPCIVDLKHPSGSEYLGLYEFSFWNDQVLHCPLIKRGWVLQERLLAPRVLRFGKTQLFWECTSLCACETFPAGWPAQNSQLMPLSKAIPHENERWQSIVEIFSGSNLSNRHDKLPAIGGVAERICRQQNPQYCAGLIRNSLPGALLWRRTTKTYLIRSIDPYTAPSWSWASCDGQVTFPAQQDSTDSPEVLCQVDNIVLNYVSAANVFGQLLPGSALKLTGPIFAITKLENEDAFLHGDEQWNDAWGYIVIKEGLSHACTMEGHIKAHRMLVTFDEASVLQERTTLMCLAILGPTNTDSWKIYYGLVLRPTVKGGNTYTRIGVFFVSGTHPYIEPAHLKMFSVTVI